MGTYIVIGMASGVIYGLAALGLVLVYKGSRVFNFAQGEFGTVAMFVLFAGVERNFGLGFEVPYVAAVGAALAAGVLLGLATERFVARPLGDAPKAVALVGTAGVALLAIGLELAVARPEPRSLPPALGGRGVGFLGYIVSQQKLLSLGVLLAVAAAAAWFFRRTLLGTAILANSQDSTAARIVGANVNRLSALTWGIAGFLGALAGVLLAPEVSFYPGYMTTIVLIPAFTAGIVGGMTSLPGAFAAGQIVGIVESMGQYLIVTYPSLAAVPEGSTLLVFLVLVIALMVRPRGLFGSEA